MATWSDCSRSMSSAPCNIGSSVRSRCTIATGFEYCASGCKKRCACSDQILSRQVRESEGHFEKCFQHWLFFPKKLKVVSTEFRRVANCSTDLARLRSSHSMVPRACRTSSVTESIGRGAKQRDAVVQMVGYQHLVVSHLFRATHQVGSGDQHTAFGLGHVTHLRL